MIDGFPLSTSISSVVRADISIRVDSSTGWFQWIMWEIVPVNKETDRIEGDTEPLYLCRHWWRHRAVFWVSLQTISLSRPILSVCLILASTIFRSSLVQHTCARPIQAGVNAKSKSRNPRHRRGPNSQSGSHYVTGLQVTFLFSYTLSEIKQTA